MRRILPQICANRRYHPLSSDLGVAHSPAVLGSKKPGLIDLRSSKASEQKPHSRSFGSDFAAASRQPPGSVAAYVVFQLVDGRRPAAVGVELVVVAANLTAVVGFEKAEVAVAD